MRPGIFVVVAACAGALAVAPRARAEGDRLDVGASFVAASQNESIRSGGMIGGAVDVVRWFGRLGVSAEAGLHHWDADGDARWVGAGVRFALVDGHHRDPRSGARKGGRVWIDAGVLEKWWDIRDDEGTPDQIDVYYAGPHEWLGIGADLDVGSPSGRWFGGWSWWFRVERDHSPDLSGAPFASIAHDVPPPATQLVLGYALYFGGAI